MTFSSTLSKSGWWDHGKNWTRRYLSRHRHSQKCLIPNTSKVTCSSGSCNLLLWHSSISKSFSQPFLIPWQHSSVTSQFNTSAASFLSRRFFLSTMFITLFTLSEMPFIMAESILIWNKHSCTLFSLHLSHSLFKALILWMPSWIRPPSSNLSDV